MNVELLRKVQKHILEEPLRLDMSHGIRKSAVAPCGTAGCIAGWAAILSGRIDPKEAKLNQYDEVYWTLVAQVGQEELGLADKDVEKVFFTGTWPEPFRDQYGEADDAQGRAEVTAARIQHLIDKGE